VEIPRCLTWGYLPTNLLILICWPAREWRALALALKSVGVQAYEIGWRLDKRAVRIGPRRLRDVVSGFTGDDCFPQIAPGVLFTASMLSTDLILLLRSPRGLESPPGILPLALPGPRATNSVDVFPQATF